jgi:hypothetical protein
LSSTIAENDILVGRDNANPGTSRRLRFPTHGLEETREVEKTGTYDKVEINAEDCCGELGYCFPAWKKWWILTVIFSVQ